MDKKLIWNTPIVQWKLPEQPSLLNCYLDVDTSILFLAWPRCAILAPRQEPCLCFPANAIFKRNLAAVTEREYGDRVGIWRLIDLFDRYNLKVTFLMNGRKVEQFADEVRAAVG